MIEYNEKEHKGYALVYGKVESSINRDRKFIFIREFVKSHYKSGEISAINYLKIMKILYEEEERLRLKERSNGI